MVAYASYSSVGADLFRFTWLSRRFASNLRSRLAVLGRVGRRGVATCCISSKRAAMRSKATSRLACCERRSVAVTVTPLGRCTTAHLNQLCYDVVHPVHW